MPQERLALDSLAVKNWRGLHPEYKDLDDNTLFQAVKRKSYGDLSEDDFSSAFNKKFGQPARPAGEAVETPTRSTASPSAEASPVSVIAGAIPAGLGGAIETFGRAGRVLGVPGSVTLVEAGKSFGGKFRQELPGGVGETVRSGVESTVQSIAAGLPGGVIGTLAGGPVGAVLGFSANSGVLFGLAEYDQFMDDVAENARAQGFGDADVERLQEEMRDKAIVSALAEGGFEAASSLISGKVLGFFKGASEPIKQTFKQLLAGAGKKLAGVTAAEVPSELATTAVQREARIQAGIPQAPLGESLAKTAGTTFVQSLLTAGVGAGARRVVGDRQEGQKQTEQQETKNIVPASSDFIKDLSHNREKAEQNIRINNIENPMPNTEFNERLENFEESQLKEIQAHGIVSVAGSEGLTSEQSLVNLIEKGVGEERTFHSGPLSRPLVGSIKPKTEAPYVVVWRNAHPKDVGIKTVVVNDGAYVNIEQLKDRYPEVSFIRADSFNPQQIEEPSTQATPTPPSAKPTEQVVEQVSDQDHQARLAWARTHIDEEEWIPSFEEARKKETGQTTSPPVISPNPGQEITRQLSDSPPVPPTERMEDTYSPSEREQPLQLMDILRRIGEKILTPEFFLRNKGKKNRNDAVKQLQAGPMRMAYDIVSAEQTFKHIVGDYETHYKALQHGLSKKERELARKAMELVYTIKSTSAPIVSQQSAKDQLSKLWAEHPKLAQVIRGTNRRGGLIELFEGVKKRMQQSKRQVFRLSLAPQQLSVFQQVVDGGAKLEDAVESTFNIEQIAKTEVIKKGRNWDKLSDARKNRKIESVRKREVKDLQSVINEYNEIANWGLRDYITNIEGGSYHVVDNEGRIYAFAETRKQAKQKAFEVRQRLERQGQPVPPFDIAVSVNRVNPGKTRQDVLVGEKDLFEILPRYVYAMEKRIIFDPVRAKLKKDIKQKPHLYDEQSIRVLNGQLDYAVGAKYSWGDQVADAVSFAFGWQTGKYSRGVAIARKIIANAKLGYRPVAMFVNAAGGFGNTYAALGSKFFVQGAGAIQSGIYTGADGRSIDMTQRLLDLEERGLMGIDFAIGEDGVVSSRTPIWHPMGLFQLPEKTLRRHSFAANYVYQREVLGKDDFEATENAILNLRFQQFTYNLAAVPALFRSPTAKLLTQFKTYMVAQSQFISTLRGKQIARVIGVQMVLNGPRGVVYMLKTLPILGALGVLDKLEEWLVEDKENFAANVATKGLVGPALGTDITAAASVQFANKPEDLVGPTVTEMLKLYNEVILPAAQQAVGEVVGKSPENLPQYVLEDGIDWVTSLPIIMSYWGDFFKSTGVTGSISPRNKYGVSVDFGEGDYLKRLQQPDVWVHDSAGRKAYKVSGLWDRILLLSGASPAEKKEFEVLRRGWRKEAEVRRKNRTKVLDKIISEQKKTGRISSELINDAILYGMDPAAIPNRYIWSEMSPQEREVMKAEIMKRAEAIDLFGLE